MSHATDTKSEQIARLLKFFCAVMLCGMSALAQATYIGDDVRVFWGSGGVPSTFDIFDVAIGDAREITEDTTFFLSGPDEFVDLGASSISASFSSPHTGEYVEIWGFDWQGQARAIVGLDLVSSTDGSAMDNFQFNFDETDGWRVIWTAPTNHLAGSFELNIITAPIPPASLAADVLLVGADGNQPRVLLVNGAATGVVIDEFALSIGDTSFNFDSATTDPISDADDDLLATLLAPDENSSGGLRTDTALFEFEGFNRGDVFGTRLEIDPDSGDGFVSYRNVLFNNGMSENARATISFRDVATGATSKLSGVFPDADQAARYQITLEGALGGPNCGTVLPIADVTVPARDYLKDNLIDDDLNTHWNNIGETFFTLVLGESSTVRCVEVAPKPGTVFTLDFYLDDVFVSTLTTTGASWDLVAFPTPLVGSEIRVVSHAPPQWFRMQEIRIRGD